MTTKDTSNIGNSKGSRGALFWIFVILLIVALCCVATLVAAWFTGDTVVEFLRNYINQ